MENHDSNHENVVPDGGPEVDLFPVLPEADEPLEIIRVDPMPVGLEVEPDIFARHEGIPAHSQGALTEGRAVLIGGGGLNGYTADGLVRSGIGNITIVDGDRVDRANLSRQFFKREDLGFTKGRRLARRIAEHAFGGANITGIGLYFEDALARFPLPADVMIAGVDNNECRLQVVREARRRHIPAVFTMLSLDGMRCQAFLQNASSLEPCLWCALPNLDPERRLPCAAAIVSSCLLASGFTIFFAHRALMGWGDLSPFNWREADLTGITPDRIGTVKRRQDCPICSEFVER